MLNKQSFFLSLFLFASIPNAAIYRAIDTIIISDSIQPIRIPNVAGHFFDTVTYLIKFTAPYIYHGDYYCWFDSVLSSGLKDTSDLPQNISLGKLLSQGINNIDSGTLKELWLSPRSTRIIPDSVAINNSAWFFPNEGTFLPVTPFFLSFNHDTVLRISTKSPSSKIICEKKSIIKFAERDSASMAGWSFYINYNKPWIPQKRITNWASDTIDSGDTIAIINQNSKYSIIFFLTEFSSAGILSNKKPLKTSRYNTNKHHFDLLGRYKNNCPSHYILISGNKRTLFMK